MNYFSFHIGDYASHTRGLSLFEDLAYRRLLDLYYLTEKPIASIEQAARSIGMHEQLAAVGYVLETHWQASECGFINKRADEEIAKFHEKQEKAAAAGRASANRRSRSVQRPLTKKEHDPKTDISTPVEHPFNVCSTSVDESATGVEHSLEIFQQTFNQPITNNHKENIKRKNEWVPDENQKAVNQWFGRRNSTAWSAKELKAWAAISEELRSEGIQALSGYYSQPAEVAQFRRRDLLTLLNNWQGEIDRWRNYVAPAGKRFDVKKLCL
jgi:uncharacterized protein YdaU (DUF1376 family)